VTPGTSDNISGTFRHCPNCTGFWTLMFTCRRESAEARTTAPATPTARAAGLAVRAPKMAPGFGTAVLKPDYVSTHGA
jgi:hypothetical protein